MDLGMPLDMTEVQGIFDRGDESGVYPYNGEVKLDPKDRALLKLPSGASGVSKSQPGVSFLRRTEYISSEIVKIKGDRAKQARFKDKALGPEDQLRVVESTFDASAEDLSKVRHPKKRNLKAVESWPLFPDSKMFDLTYLSVRLVGSASLNSTKRQFSEDSLSTALFRQNVVGNDEWMSLYTADDETSKRLKSKLESPDDTLALDTDDVYRFTRVQDNDIDLQVHAEFQEMAVSFTDNHQTSYLPIVGRTNLKRRRVLKHRRELVNESNVGAVDLSLRQITPQESIVRDNARSAYDPVSYTMTQLPEDDDEAASE
jgi:RNA polymerase II-associated factor 1